MLARSQFRHGGKQFSYVGVGSWGVPEIMISVAEEIQKPKVLIPAIEFGGNHQPTTPAEAIIQCRETQ